MQCSDSQREGVQVISYFLLKTCGDSCAQSMGCPRVISRLVTGWGKWVHSLDLGYRLVPGFMEQDSSSEPHDIGANRRKELREIAVDR